MKTSAPSSLAAAVIFLLCATFVDRVLDAQALPTATGPGSLLAVGGEGSYYQMDYGQRTVGGAAVFVEVDPTWRFGAEAEVRFSRFHTDEDVTETNYLAGPRITLSRRPGKVRPYAKFLIGVGKITLPFDYARGNFLAYAPGGGVDYVLNDRWTIRAADFEYQDWPKFSYGVLHPYGVSAGVIFRINPLITIPNHARGRN
jgi:opacity protein-like surface antigen